MRNAQIKDVYNKLDRPASGGPSKFIRLHHRTKASHHPNDMYILKLFLTKLLKTYPNKLDKIVADSGYESEGNYVYLAEDKLTSYIKPSNYEQSKTLKYK